MTELKPEIVLASKVRQIIEWFSINENWEKEIGALCVGEFKKGNIHISELLFPEQEVTGTTVQFKTEDWASIVATEKPETIQKIIGYWHKHPNGTSSSSIDEEETIDVFMAPETERKIFCFMISAPKSYNNTDVEIEGRIEIRGDIDATIEADISEYRVSKVDSLCKKIIKDKIKELELGDAPEPIQREPIQREPIQRMAKENNNNYKETQTMIINGNQVDVEVPNPDTSIDVPKTTFDTEKIKFPGHTIAETSLKCTRDKNRWKIVCGSAFMEMYYSEFSILYQRNAIDNLNTQAFTEGKQHRYLMTFEVSHGCIKKFKRLLLNLINAWETASSKHFGKTIETCIARDNTGPLLAQ